MFELTEVKNYDTHHRYGTDWHTDYYIKTDEKLTFDEVIRKLRELKHNPCGECKLIVDEEKNEMVLETIMY